MAQWAQLVFNLYSFYFNNAHFWPYFNLILITHHFKLLFEPNFEYLLRNLESTTPGISPSLTYPLYFRWVIYFADNYRFGQEIEILMIKKIRIKILPSRSSTVRSHYCPSIIQNSDLLRNSIGLSNLYCRKNLIWDSFRVVW